MADHVFRYLMLFVSGLSFAIAALLAFHAFGSAATVSDVLGVIALGLLALIASMFP